MVCLPLQQYNNCSDNDARQPIKYLEGNNMELKNKATIFPI